MKTCHYKMKFPCFIDSIEILLHLCPLQEQYEVGPGSSGYHR